MTWEFVNSLCGDLTYNLLAVLFKIPAQKPTWSETETQFSYAVTSAEDSFRPKSVITTAVSYLPQPPVTSQQDVYKDTSYRDTSYQDTVYQETGYQDTSYQDSSYQDTDFQDTGFQETSYQQNGLQFGDQQYDKQDPPYQEQKDYEYQYQEEQKQKILQQQQYQEEQQHQQQYQQDQQKYQQDQQQYLQQQQQYQQQQQQQQQKQPLQPTQQLQSTVMTGAATLGSLMAGGAKKLGSFFGAAAAAVAAPAISQPAPLPSTTATVSQYTTAIAPVTPYASTTSVPVASVPEISATMPVTIVTTSAPITLPRTPSLKRQESIQRPPVRRTRTLPDAPEDMPPSSYESAYEDDYNKTETDQLTDRDRTSLDRYRDDEYLHDTIPEEVTDEPLHEEASPSIQKTASPTKTVTQVRKPSVDSYHSQTPSIIDRKPSQSSFHQEETPVVPITQEG